MRPSHGTAAPWAVALASSGRRRDLVGVTGKPSESIAFGRSDLLVNQWFRNGLDQKVKALKTLFVCFFQSLRAVGGGFSLRFLKRFF